MSKNNWDVRNNTDLLGIIEAQLVGVSISRPSHIAIAVSGGSDSMALVLLAHGWAKRNQVKMTALTVDHALRPESAQEAQRVQSWLYAKHIDHHILTYQGVTPLANIQAQAREIRYQLLLDYCKTHQIDQLWLGHHQQDQAETFLIRLIRGSGIDGLTGMSLISKKEDLTLVRPLLTLSKETLQNWLQEQQQDWIEDPSNHNSKFGRIRVRKWLDKLEADEKKLLIQRLNQTAQHMARSSDFIATQLEEAVKEIIIPQKEGYVLFNRSLWLTLHEELGLRVLARSLMWVSGQYYKPRFEELWRLFSQLRQTNYAGSSLYGCIVTKPNSAGELVIYREPAAIKHIISLVPDQEICWDGRFNIQLKTAIDSPVYVEVLQDKYLQAIAFNGDIKQNLPLKNIIYTLPVFIQDKKILAIPFLNYYSNKRIEAGLSAQMKDFFNAECHEEFSGSRDRL